MRVVMGHSDDIEVADAIRIVINQCREALRGERPKAGIFFTSVLDTEFVPLLDAILDAFPGIILVGCTTDGEISSLNDFLDDSLALLLFCGDDLRFGGGIAQNISRNFYQTALEAKRQAQLALGGEGRLCLAFPDGLSCIHLPIGTYLQKIFGKGYAVFGGNSGDQFQFKQTYQFFGREVFTDALPILLIDGEILLSSSLRSGWIPIGKRYEITSKANVVQRIGDKTALEFYQYYLGESSNQYTQFPLAVFEKIDGKVSEKFYLRDPFLANQQNGSVPFFGAFPEECLIQLTEIGRDDLLEAAAEASLQAVKGYPGTSPDLILIFSCATRRQILGSKAGEECHTIRAVRPAVPFFGFYTYGELGPCSLNTNTHFHNDSYLVIALGTK